MSCLRPLNFNYTFVKALLIFCHCRALFSSVLFLKIIVNNVLHCCTVNLSRHNYFLANKNLLFYPCLFVYIIKRTLHGGLKIRIYFLVAKTILFCHSKIKLIHIFAPPCNILYLFKIYIRRRGKYPSLKHSLLVVNLRGSSIYCTIWRSAMLNQLFSLGS